MINFPADRQSLPILSFLHQHQSFSMLQLPPFENTLPTPLISVGSASTIQQNIRHQLSLWCEMKQIMWVTWTLILTQLCELGPQFCGLIMVGHLPNSAMMLSGVGLARVFSNITAYRIVWGSQTALFTLVNEATNNKNLLRIYAQRAFYISIITSLPLLIIQYFCGSILTAIGQPKELFHIMNISCYMFIPNIYFKCWLSILRRLTQSLDCGQNCLLDLRKSAMFVSLIFAMLSYPVSYICVNTFHLGFMVIPIVINLYTLMNLCGTLFILWYSGYLRKINLFKPAPLKIVFQKQHIIFYLKKSGWGTLHSQFKWWMYEITLIFAGFIHEKPQIAVSVLIISTNILSISGAIGGGLQHALCIVTGKYIGDQMEDSAKQCVKAGTIISFLFAIVMVSLLLTLHGKITCIFTNNDEIIHIISYIMYLVIFKQFFLILSQASGGIFRAIGRTDFSTNVLFTSYYLIALPLLIILLFVNGYNSSLLLGTMTIFGALTLGTCISSIVMQLYFIFCIDWRSVFNEAQTRINQRFINTSVNHNAVNIPNYGSTHKCIIQQSSDPTPYPTPPQQPISTDILNESYGCNNNVYHQNTSNRIVTFSIHMTNLYGASSSQSSPSLNAYKLYK